MVHLYDATPAHHRLPNWLLREMVCFEVVSLKLEVGAADEYLDGIYEVLYFLVLLEIWGTLSLLERGLKSHLLE